MINNKNVVDTILFSSPLDVIKKQLQLARKDSFDANERIIIHQDINDEYPYIDSAGKKLIEIQKIINSVDISNCFILLITPNLDIKSEIEFITKFYSVDPFPINFLIIDGQYNKEVKKYQNTSCKKLWNHLYVGTDFNINPCCIADHRFPMGNINNDSLADIRHLPKTKQIRSWMKQGYRSISCNTCYHNEDRGINSNRQPCDPYNQDVKITTLDIRLNNICNFKCRMCSEYFSSAIQEETITLYGENPILGVEQISLEKSTQDEKSNVFSKVDPYLTKDIESIYFAGGEPLITLEHYLILDKLINIGNRDIAISYNTNLSKLKYKNYNVIDYWNQFNNVTVGASIDASHRVAEYVRHGTVWNEIVQNINMLKDHAPSVNLKITSTVSFLTVENLIQLQTTWIDNHVFNINDLSISVLTNPAYLSVSALPEIHKDRLSKIIQNHIMYLGNTRLAESWKSVLLYMNRNDHRHTLDDFKNRTRVLDEYRKESFIEIFPEFYDLYNF